MIKKYIFGIGAAFTCLVLASSAVAQTVGELHTWSFDAATIEKGYTVSTPDGRFHLGILPGVLMGETDVTIKVFDHVSYTQRELYQVNTAVVDEIVETLEESRIVLDWPLPEGMEIVSLIYEFDIKGAADLYNPELPLWLRTHFDAATQEKKGIYFYDKGQQLWVEIPAEIHAADQSFRSAIHLTYAPMAILAQAIPTVGEASWYKWRDCNCAASRDYPAGSLLKVTHEPSGNSVIVQVNDYGPEEWTGRIIDLDVIAFEQLVPKGYGITTVHVEPYIPTEEDVLEGEIQTFIN